MNRSLWKMMVALSLLLLANYATATLVKERVTSQGDTLLEQLEPYDPGEFSEVVLYRKIQRAIEREEVNFIPEGELTTDRYLSVVSEVRSIAIGSTLELMEFQVTLPEEGERGMVSMILRGSVTAILEFVAKVERLGRGVVPGRMELRRGDPHSTLRVELSPNLLPVIEPLHSEVAIEDMEIPESPEHTIFMEETPAEISSRLFARYPRETSYPPPDVTRLGTGGRLQNTPGWVELSGVEMKAERERIYLFVDRRSGRIRRLRIGGLDGGWHLARGRSGVTLTIEEEKYQVMEILQ